MAAPDRYAESRGGQSHSFPRGFAPRTPLHRRSRGPLGPAPRRWLARSAHSLAHLGIESGQNPALMPQETDVTRLLLAWSDGTQAAGAPLMDAVYDELRQIARGY